MRKIMYSPILIAIILFLSGCGAGSNAEDSSENKKSETASETPYEQEGVEIKVVTSYGGDDGNRQNYERALRDYEASSGNTIIDESGISNEQWKLQIMSSFNSGTEPDVLFFFTGADSNKIISDGKVVSIEEIREVYPDYANNMKDEMLSTSLVDGKNYAVPVNGYWEGLYVNKKVLEACGVEIPDANTTWAQFVEDCKKIAEQGYVPIAASLGVVPHYWFEFCIFNNSSVENHLILPENPDDNIGEIWQDGLYDIKELYELGFFPDDTLDGEASEIEALIINDKAAFMIDGSWKMGWFAENAADINDFTVTYVPAKGERKPTDIIGGLSMGYFITRRAWENPDKQAACVEFVEAMTADEVVATFGATAVTALKKGIEPPAEASSLVKDALKMTGGVTEVVSATADNLSLDSRSSLFSNISAIVSGKITAADAIEQALEIGN